MTVVGNIAHTPVLFSLPFCQEPKFLPTIFYRFLYNVVVIICISHIPSITTWTPPKKLV